MSDIDKTPAEMRALDALTQIRILDAIYAELKTLGDHKQTALDNLAAARIAVLNEATNERKALVIDAKCKFDKIGVALSTRKEQAKILQTLLRAQPN